MSSSTSTTCTIAPSIVPAVTSTTSSSTMSKAGSAVEISSAEHAIQSQSSTASAKNQSQPPSTLSPSMDSIMKAYALQGNNDVELLKALLNAKAKEDERLAALDLLRAEQLRAASTLAMYQGWWMTAAAQQQQHNNPSSGTAAGPTSSNRSVASGAAQWTPASPPASGTEDLAPWQQQLGQRRYSPVPPYSLYPSASPKATTTPLSSSPAMHSTSNLVSAAKEPSVSGLPSLGSAANAQSTLCSTVIGSTASATKRPRAASTVSNSSSRSSTSTATVATSIESNNNSGDDDESMQQVVKKVKRTPKNTETKKALAKKVASATHEEVMTALRAKCERNLTSSKSSTIATGTKVNRPRVLAPRPIAIAPSAPVVTAKSVSSAPVAIQQKCLAPVPPRIAPSSTSATVTSPRRDDKSASPPLRQSAVFTPADERIAAGSLRMLINATAHVSAPSASSSTAVESH